MDKSYDKESLKSFKSLKGWRYLSDGFVQNMWIHELPTGIYLYLRCHCFASLKSRKFTYLFEIYVCVWAPRALFIPQSANAKQDLGRSVVLLLLSCFSLKTSSAKGYQRYQKMSRAQELQQWHAPLKRDVQAAAVKDITCPKAQYGKTPQVVSKRLVDSNFTPQGTMDKAVIESLLTQGSQAWVFFTSLELTQDVMIWKDTDASRNTRCWRNDHLTTRNWYHWGS